MKFYLLFVVSLLFLNVSVAQEKGIIETIDIDNFWFAFDKLAEAKTTSDSVEILQIYYIDNASQFFKEFIRVRNFTAEEYVRLIGKYPRFWQSIRPQTEKIKNRKKEIEKLLDLFERALPEFKKPNVCFAIGCLRTGGTVTKDLILIGSEIAASDEKTEKSELSPWLQTIIGTFGDIVSMVSHEVIHTQQKSRFFTNLATRSINEGVADFLSEKIAGYHINKVSFDYGVANDCALRKVFLADFKKDKQDISNWLYNGNSATQYPADLGYYIGYKIAEDYYERSHDKQKAIRRLLNNHKYMKIFSSSNFLKEDCN